MFLKLGSHYPPLRGIVQLTNSAALHFRNWSFTIKLAAQEQRRIIIVDQWLKEIKENCDPKSLGMILAHNGIVRGTANC